MKPKRPKLLSKRQADDLAKELMNGLAMTELSGRGYVTVSGIDFAGVQQKAVVLFDKCEAKSPERRHFYLAHTIRQFIRRVCP